MNPFHSLRTQPTRALALLAALALALGAAGCSKPTSADSDASPGAQEAAPKRSSSKQKKSTTADASKDAENEAIDFHNHLYGFLNTANKPLKKISEKVTDAVTDAHRGANADNTRWQMLLMSESDFKKIPNHKLTAPETFSAEDQKIFNEGIKTVRDSVNEIINIINGLSTYYKAEDYKDDWYKKLYMAEPRIETLIETIDQTSGPLAERIDGITEEIDNRNVAKIPVGKYVLNMRGFMKKYRKMTGCLLRPELIDESYSANVSSEKRQTRIATARPWIEKAEALCAELDELAATQRTLKVADYEGTSYDKTYQEFYNNYDSSKVNTRRIIRELRERGVTNDDHNIKSDQSSIGRHLGDFVDRWNTKGSSGK